LTTILQKQKLYLDYTKIIPPNKLFFHASSLNFGINLLIENFLLKYRWIIFIKFLDLGYYMRRLLRHLIAGTKGGYNRAKIIKILEEEPSNAYQLSEKLDLNYKTVRHHLKVLEKNYLVKSSGDKYGSKYSLSIQLEKNIEEFHRIWDKIEENRKK